MEVTVVSFLPFAINEVKPGLIPDTYRVPGIDKNGNPGVLVIEDAKSNLYVRDGLTYPITHSAEEIANAVINDYWIAQLQASEDARPAMFWVLGAFTAEEILAKFKTEVSKAKLQQFNWFAKLVRLADDDWERFKQHRMISDIQRFAARSIGLTQKPWMLEPESVEVIKCPFCASVIEKNVAICKFCNQVVDKKKAEALGMKVA